MWSIPFSTHLPMCIVPVVWVGVRFNVPHLPWVRGRPVQDIAVSVGAGLGILPLECQINDNLGVSTLIVI